MIKKSILVVDDDELIRLALKINLERAGFNISIAETAESALELLKEHPYDLLLTDYLMPGINGLELMQQAKKIYPEIKGIIFSGFAEKDMPEKFLALGADYFFHKPINTRELLNCIQNLLAP